MRPPRKTKLARGSLSGAARLPATFTNVFVPRRNAGPFALAASATAIALRDFDVSREIITPSLALFARASASHARCRRARGRVWLEVRGCDLDGRRIDKVLAVRLPMSRRHLGT